MYSFFHHSGGIANRDTSLGNMSSCHYALRADDAVVFYHALFQDRGTIGYPNSVTYDGVMPWVNSFS